MTDEVPDLPLGDGADPSGTDAPAGTSERDESDAGAEDEDEEVEPVEVLVQLARDGEIDPWDIDIVAVTDKFLDRIDGADLRVSGRALFYASVLLRMKSDELLSGEDDEEEEELEPWERDPGMAPGADPDGEYQGPDPIDGLEREMERRLERKRARGTPETLDELVRELREAERNNRWKESREYDTDDSPSGYRRGVQQVDYRADDAARMAGEPGEDEVTGTAHGEDIEAITAEVRRTLDEQYDAGRDEVLFAEVCSAGGSRVETYLGVLFLAHRGHVVLQQDELFGDLWIRNPATVSGTGEDGAVAD